MAQPDYRKKRQQARMIVTRVGVSLFLKAQNHKCSICGEWLSAKKLTIDHVFCLASDNEKQNVGNLLLCHHECNQIKGNKPPSQHEIDLLDRVNELLGYDEVSERYRCRQDLVSKYFKLSLWMNELQSRNSDQKTIDNVLIKMNSIEQQVGEWVVM